MNGPYQNNKSGEVLKLRQKIKEIRSAIADYMESEGCSCCQDVDAHREHYHKLGKLLGVKKYSDNSGYEFSKYRSNKK